MINPSPLTPSLPPGRGQARDPQVWAAEMPRGAPQAAGEQVPGALLRHPGPAAAAAQGEEGMKGSERGTLGTTVVATQVSWALCPQSAKPEREWPLDAAKVYMGIKKKLKPPAQ